jgi:predicted AlkP superfamily pyrophosphatase or phosphodiesterase
MKRRCVGFVSWIAFALILAGPICRIHAETSSDPDRIVVMISLDGLAAYYMDDPQAEMPTLRELAAAGARAQSMKASNPTVTWTNHTTLVTGVNPARHGVVGNNYYDRATDKRVTLISDPVYDKDQIVKVPTIYDLAKQAGLKTAAIRWPASRNAKTLDWTVPDVAADNLLDQYSTPSLVAECKAAGIWAEGESQGASDNVRIIADDVCTKEFIYILQHHRPNLALLHLIDIDHIEHLKGPKSPEAYANVKTADGQVREVWDELKKDFPGKATLIVVSDHGFSPIEHGILPNIVLRNAGLIEVKGTRVVGGSVRLVAQGGCALLYITDEANRATIIEKVKKSFDGLDGVSKVIASDEFKDYGVADPKDDPHAPDMILFAKEGYNFGDTAAGALPFNVKPERKGSHGHDAELPDLHATFVAWGVGIKSGKQLGEIQNIDVAPTVAKLLNIPMPNADGKPLAAALSE